MAQINADGVWIVLVCALLIGALALTVAIGPTRSQSHLRYPRNL
jgi:hypothetical protein